MNLTARYITADWCAPCRTFKPLAIRVFEEYGIPLEIIDVEDIDPSENVKSIPTILFNNTDIRTTGAWPEDKLRALLDGMKS